MIFKFIGAMANSRYGLLQGLALSGLSIAAINLLISVLTVLGPDIRTLMLFL